VFYGKGKGPILETKVGFPSWSRAVLDSHQPACDRSHKPGGRLPLLSARPAVTFLAAKHHHRLSGTKLYCLATEAQYNFPKVALGSAAARIRTRDILITNPAP